MESHESWTLPVTKYVILGKSPRLLRQFLFCKIQILITSLLKVKKNAVTSNLRTVITSGRNVGRSGFGNGGTYKGICNNLFLKLDGGNRFYCNS